MDPIHLFVPTFRVDECLEAIRECLEKGWTGLGYKTIEFEAAWKSYTGLAQAHFLNSATSGLHLAVALLKRQGGWQDGDEVVTTPLTFVSTNHAILYENLKPVFADVDDYLCLDLQSVSDRITPRTRAVVFVGLGGNTGRLAEIAGLCRERGLRLILDASHMTGTRWNNGTHVGGEADVSVFSFQAVKNLPTADSGMICFTDPALGEEVRRWTWLGINKDTYARTLSDSPYKWQYEVEQVGYKYHGNSIMAAIGLVSLRYVEADNAYRRQLAAWYDELLAGEPGIRPVKMSPECVPSRHLYQVEVNDRDKIMLAMNRADIYPGVHYRDNTRYRMYSDGWGTCPRAHRAGDQIISLPMHLHLERSQVEYVAAVLKETVLAQSG